MKYTLEGYQQQKLLDYGFTVVTACVLRTLSDMQKGFEKRIFDDKEYFWLDQGYLVEQLPAVAKRTKILAEVKDLEEKGFLEKKLSHIRNGVKGNWSYIRLTEKVVELTEYDKPNVQYLVRDTNKVIRDTNKGYSPDEQGVIRDTNNKDISINTSTIKDNKKKKSTPKGVPTTQKTSYGEFNNVLLEDVEYKKLVDRFGSSYVNNQIEALSQYIKSRGVKYQSHYATILSWERRDSNKRKQQPPQEQDQEEDGNEMYITPDGVVTKYTKDYIKSDLVETRWDENDRTKVAYYGIDPNNLSGGYRRLDI